MEINVLVDEANDVVSGLSRSVVEGMTRTLELPVCVVNGDELHVGSLVPQTVDRPVKAGLSSLKIVEDTDD